MNCKEFLINPTLACGNPLNYKEDLDILNSLGNKILHIDIMDGHYVPNICFDLNTVRTIKNHYDFVLDIHLMVTNPEHYIEALQEAGVEMVSFHLDATAFSIRLLQQVRKCGMKAGIVINPSQPVLAAKQVLPYVDYVLLMAVEPGFSGQQFLPQTIEKIRELKELQMSLQYDFFIEIDGGIDDANSVECIRAGADILVSGAFGVFRKKYGLSEDYLALKNVVENIV